MLHLWKPIFRGEVKSLPSRNWLFRGNGGLGTLRYLCYSIFVHERPSFMKQAHELY